MSEPHAPETGGRSVAILLAAAAIVAALLGARAGLLASDATSGWADAVIQEQKRGASLIADLNRVYVQEASQAFTVMAARAWATELRTAVDAADPAVALALTPEVRVAETIAQVSEEGARQVAIVADPRYRLPAGGYDLGRYLADLRIATQEDPPIDPDATTAAADRASERSAQLLTLAVVAAIALLVGAQAQAWQRRRRPLLIAGWAILAVAALPGLVIGLAP